MVKEQSKVYILKALFNNAFTLKDLGPGCIKLTINGKLDLNGNYHRILGADWLYGVLFP